MLDSRLRTAQTAKHQISSMNQTYIKRNKYMRNRYKSYHMIDGGHVIERPQRGRRRRRAELPECCCHRHFPLFSPTLLAQWLFDSVYRLGVCGLSTYLKILFRGKKKFLLPKSKIILIFLWYYYYFNKICGLCLSRLFS